MKNLFDIDGKVALVTGGSSGIGLMIARGFVSAGAKVYISSRKADVCEQVAEELSQEGSCIAIPADLSTEAEAIAPGKYLVVLEPQAVADLLTFLVGSLDARAADEGRSYFSHPDGGTRLGEELFHTSVTLRSDPADAANPAAPFAIATRAPSPRSDACARSPTSGGFASADRSPGWRG